mgnify:CR=1 FL=1
MRDEADASCGSRSRATTKSSEDYLEAILVIRRLRGSCRNVDIAERLGFSKASVTKALGNLARKGLVEVAEETLSKHRFFERLLANAGVNAEVASKEACRMEHCISTDSFEKLSSHLGRIQDSLR